MRSHRSRNSGAGGLCDVRMAFTPMSLSNPAARSQTRSGTAAPTAPPSWCRQTPLSFTGLPLSRKPWSASNAIVRMPNGVSVVSTARAPSSTVVRSVYRFGASTDQSIGDSTRRRWSSSADAPAASENAVSPRATSRPAASTTTVRSVPRRVERSSLSTRVRTSTMARAESTYGVVTYTPQCATCSGSAIVSQVWR